MADLSTAAKVSTRNNSSGIWVWDRSVIAGEAAQVSISAISDSPWISRMVARVYKHHCGASIAGDAAPARTSGIDPRLGDIDRSKPCPENPSPPPRRL